MTEDDVLLRRIETLNAAVAKANAERDEALRRAEDQWAGWVKADCRVRALETALKGIRQTILDDDTAITDTLWMSDSIIKGCTAVDYIDFALTAAPANGADTEAIDRAAKFLRETQQGGKNLTPWEQTPKATKKKWMALAEGTLSAANTVAIDT